MHTLLKTCKDCKYCKRSTHYNGNFCEVDDFPLLYDEAKFPCEYCEYLDKETLDLNDFGRKKFLDNNL